MEFLKDFWLYLKTHKKFWLLPIFAVLIVMGFLIVFVGSSPLSPFVYTLF